MTERVTISVTPQITEATVAVADRNSVRSAFGRVGDIIAALGDYTASLITTARTAINYIAGGNTVDDHFGGIDSRLGVHAADIVSLDSELGDVSGYAPNNYSPAAATARGHFEGIDSALLSAGGGEWTRDEVNGYLYPSTLTDRIFIGTSTPISLYSDRILQVKGKTLLNGNVYFKPNDNYNEGHNYIGGAGGNRMLVSATNGLDLYGYNGGVNIYANNEDVYIGTVGTGSSLGINTTSISAKLHTVGSGNTSATYTAKFQNSDGADILTLRDDGIVNIDPDNSFTSGTKILTIRDTWSWNNLGDISARNLTASGYITCDTYAYDNTSNKGAKLEFYPWNNATGLAGAFKLYTPDLASEPQPAGTSVVKGVNAYLSAVTYIDGGDLLVEGGDPASGGGSYGNVLLAQNGGNVGIGTSAPARKLHISDAMRLEPISSAPATPSEGDLYADSTTHKLRYYDGTTWQDLF